jgi:hypothetical protein
LSRIVFTHAAQHELNAKSTIIQCTAKADRVVHVVPTPYPTEHKQTNSVDSAMRSEGIPPSASMNGPSNSFPPAIETVDDARRREMISRLDESSAASGAPTRRRCRPESDEDRIDSVDGNAHLAAMTDR